jgi:DNA-binding transcriptional regulator YdaS (Cro superfamily)
MSDSNERGDIIPEVAEYKRLLRSFLNRRPSGTRTRLASALGTHKSFVSQITNPDYRVAIPAHHVPTIVQVCRLSPEERRAFLDAYRVAHPDPLTDPGPDLSEPDSGSSETRIVILVPRFRSAARQAEVIAAIEELASRIIALGADSD